MYRLTVVLSSLLLVAAWSAPIDAAEEQRRARRRDSGAAQTQRAPQRAAPRASAPQRPAPARRAPAARERRGDQRGGSARRAVPRRAPRSSTGSGRVEQFAPPANARGSRVTAPRGNRVGTAVRRVGRSGDRNTRTGRAGSSRQGIARVDRRPPRGRVVGTAVRRPPLSSRPIIVNNFGGRGSARGYTPYLGRYRYGSPRIYGTSFYFPGYSTFNIWYGAGYGSRYHYDPYWYGPYGPSYGYSRYGYGGYADAYYTGSLRLKVKPRFGEVLVDGYYVGLVNDYDGIFQRLRLEEGPHHIEIREPGFEPLAFEVLILPGETITYEGYLRPLR